MAEGDTIHRLDQSTIERIAAGEVVERPASVVKELVENSLDADASRVRVAVERGGKDGIRVTDDGVGMGEEAVEKAVEKHTTSKIADIADLDAGVGSLGFRGEALASIGAVARLTVTTKPRGASRGTELRMAGGEVESVEPAGCPEGTTVEVTDLFYNVPARRKYLKQDATEFAHVNRVTTGYALANPDAALVLEHDDREVFSTTGQGSLEATVLSVYGREVAEAMVTVETGADDLPDGPLDSVTGVVSHPETNRASPKHCSPFINGRYVTARGVRDAVVEAYGSQLAPDRYPFAVLFLSLPADAVDVNVHPRKLEVRFADESDAKSQVRAAVENTLLDAGLVRSGAPRGQSAPDQTAIEPTADADDDGGASAPFHAGPDSSTDESRPDGAADSTDDSRVAPAGESSGPNESDHSTDATASDPTESDDDGRRSDSQHSDRRSDGRRDGGRAATAPDLSMDGVDEGGNGTPVEPGRNRKFTGGDEQTTLSGERVADDPDFETLPPLRVLGQLHDTYIACESPDGLVLIDQHAADERINYERLRERVAGGTDVQELADPVKIELTPAEAELYAGFADALANLGFRADRDDRRVEIRAVPAVLSGAAEPELLREVLTSFAHEEDPDDPIERSADAVLADLACYPSVTGNTSLAEGTVIDLLTRLDACENPYACPHGRPVVIEIGEHALEDRFERDYPGHAGRRADDPR